VWTAKFNPRVPFSLYAPGDEGGNAGKLEVSTIDVARPSCSPFRFRSAGLGNALRRGPNCSHVARGPGSRAPLGNFRLGPHLRRDEARQASVTRVSSERASHDRMSGLIVAALGRRVPEHELDHRPRGARSLQPSVVEFRGMADLFSPLVGRDPFIRHQLWHMTRRALRSSDSPYGGDSSPCMSAVGTSPGRGSPRINGGVNQYTALSWFVGWFGPCGNEQALRRVPIVVFMRTAVMTRWRI